MRDDLDSVLKAAYPQVVATLTRVLGDMDRAMDVTQDAVIKALQVWPKEGLPRSPVAWLVAVGRNRGIDQLRRDKKSVGIDNVIAFPEGISDEGVAADLDDLVLSELEDDMLRLMFTCCHPALSPLVQITLVMKVVLGFSVEEISKNLLASKAGVEKRLARARKTLADAQADYTVPRGAELPARLQGVLQAIYLMFNQGYSKVMDGQLPRSQLIDEAIRLARITARLMRKHPDPRALLALMLLNAARIPGRFDEEGMLIPLAEQNRQQWDRTMTREGLALIDAIFVARHPPSAYQIQAAVSALHNRAEHSSTTDWSQIVGLYEKLKDYDRSPVVPVNQAVALCLRGDAEAAAQVLATVADSAQLQDYQPYYVAAAYVAETLGDSAKAKQAYAIAIDLSQSTAQRAYLEKKSQQLSS
ncbi:MAG: sigma-70 family RNA polymerase sigma factor [Pseudomonadota bacterium]